MVILVNIYMAPIDRAFADGCSARGSMSELSRPGIVTSAMSVLFETEAKGSHPDCSSAVQ